MKEVHDRDVDQFYHTSHSRVKLKKGSIERIKTDINNNSRVFFSTLKKINEEILVSETLDRATTIADKPKTLRKKILQAIMLIVNILLLIVVFYTFATEQGGVHPLSELLAGHPNWRFLLVAILLFAVTNILNACKFFIYIKHKTGKFKPLFSLKVAIVGRYYDLITPLGSGGQPFEMHYFRKHGYSPETSTTIPVAKYMVWQLSFFLLCLGILIAYSAELISSPLLLVLGWVGLSVVLLIFLFVFIMSIPQKIGPSLVVGVLKLLRKMKIIKNYRATLFHVLKFVKSYQFSLKETFKNPVIIISQILITMAGIVANSLIAFFIYLTFVPAPTVEWWEIVCKCCLCDLTACFIPLPGGSGAQEISFSALLGSLFPEGSFFWGVLFWRILTYYLYIGQGAILLVSDAVINKIKHRSSIKPIPSSEYVNSDTNAQ